MLVSKRRGDEARATLDCVALLSSRAAVCVLREAMMTVGVAQLANSSSMRVILFERLLADVGQPEVW